MAGTATPVVLIHGLWLHALSWRPWLDYFRDAGYAPLAPGWPGEPATVEEARAQPERVARIGIEAVVEAYVEVIDALPTPPVVIGHSFGGLIAQRLLTGGHACA